jgi:hypothetical protein
MTPECLHDKKNNETENSKGRKKYLMVELKSKYKIIAFTDLIQFYIQE